MTKRPNIPNKIFDYIYITWYKRLFLLTWYDDLTYADEVTSNGTIIKKFLLETCCINLSCNNLEPEYLQRDPFI